MDPTEICFLLFFMSSLLGNTITSQTVAFQQQSFLLDLRMKLVLIRWVFCKIILIKDKVLGANEGFERWVAFIRLLCCLSLGSWQACVPQDPIDFRCTIWNPHTMRLCIFGGLYPFCTWACLFSWSFWASDLVIFPLGTWRCFLTLWESGVLPIFEHGSGLLKRYDVNVWCPKSLPTVIYTYCSPLMKTQSNLFKIIVPWLVFIYLFSCLCSAVGL